MKKLDQKGFGVVEGLLSLIAITLIVGIGFYVINANEGSKDATTNTPITSQKTEPKPTEQKTAQKSDKELIVEAMKETGAPTADGSKQPVTSVVVDEIVGNNAKGTATSGSGFSFVAHKADGKWSIVFNGQELPGKEIGTKYNLPQGWYSNDY